MRNLLRCRRGAAALTTVVALVPLIGAVGLGAEAGSWYVTKQRAQSAADAAAYAGALRLACSLGAVSCTDTQSVDYRGKEFAAQNAFCNAGDTTAYPGSQCATSLPTGTSQAVQINTLTAWNGGNGNFVQATVGQQESTVLARLVGLPSVNIRAQATAKITGPKRVCALGLGRYSGSGSPTSAVVFAGSEALSGTGCAFQSDNTVKFASAPSFSGSGWAVYAVKGCINSGTCDPGVPYNYYMPPATNPLAKLDTESFNNASGSSKLCGKSSGSVTISNSQSCSIASNTPTIAYSNVNLNVNNGGTVTFTAGGTYFFKDSSISISGAGTTVSGSSVNIVLLGDSTLSSVVLLRDLGGCLSGRLGGLLGLRLELLFILEPDRLYQR